MEIIAKNRSSDLTEKLNSFIKSIAQVRIDRSVVTRLFRPRASTYFCEFSVLNKHFRSRLKFEVKLLVGSQVEYEKLENP